MSTRAFTRRAAISTLGALLLAPGLARAQGPVRFRNIVVDVAPLRATSGDPTAAWVEESLPGLLTHAFGPYLAPGDRSGVTLIAQIGWVYLGPSSGGTGPLGSSQDTIKGVLLVQGPRGSVAAETPLRATSNYFPMGVNQALVGESNHDRIVKLAQAFAHWAPGQLGL
jgi:hypothetical protein